jgi:hypothetical protein
MPAPDGEDDDWFDVNPVRCRHCGEEIMLAGTEWIERETGFTACIKGQVKPVRAWKPGEDRFTPPVLHEPMPAGLEGSAE